VTVQLPAKLFADRGPQDHAAAQAQLTKRSSSLSQLGRPEDGTDTKLPSNLEIVRSASSRSTSGGRKCTASKTCRGDGQNLARARHRLHFFAADPR